MFNISFFFSNARVNKSIIISKKFLFIFKFKPLQLKLHKRNGKSSSGSYTIFSKGSSRYNKYNIVDYCRTKINLPAILIGNNFDNFKFCFLGLLKFLNGSFSYILLPHKLSLGYLVLTTNQTFRFLSSLGFCRPLYSINTKERIFNLTCGYGKKGSYSRAAGTFSQIIRRSKKGVLVKLPSGSTKLFPECSLATVGRASNVSKNSEIVKNFGFKKKLGWKSIVRGVAKNPCDHPHGGTTKGGKPKMNPWGRVFK